MPDLSNPVNRVAPQVTELAALVILEATIDGVRFRLDGLRPDLLRERPDGFTATMVEVVSSLRRGEQAFVEVLRRALQEDTPTLNTDFALAPSAYVPNPFDELGTFLNAREDALAILRRMTEAQWQRSVIDRERGQQTLRELAVARAAYDKQQLDTLEALRTALVTSTRPGIRTLQGNRLPDSSS